MRTISIVLFEATIDEVSSLFARSGLEQLQEDPSRWNYPRSPGSVLYVSCKPYEFQNDSVEEHSELLLATGGRCPATHVSADISGRAPGDIAVLFLVELLLGNFAGAAFDDWTSYTHAWTLDEIQAKTKFGGFAFFDYIGHHEQIETAPN